MDKKDESTPMIVQVPSMKSFHVVVVVVLIAQAFLLGSLWTKVEVLKGGGVATQPPVAAGQVAGTVATPPAPQTADDVPKITDRDHIRGDINARLALIEYSDIECPFCKQFHPTAQKVVDEYKGQVQWVFRHYPLSFHANAQKEAEAVECANEQGGTDAFWKMTDTIYERTTSGGTGFTLDKLGPLAAELGLNQVDFQACLDDGKYASLVKDDMDGGTKAGVTGTPGNILLDTKTGATRIIPGAVPFDQVKSAIDEMLKA